MTRDDLVGDGVSDPGRGRTLDCAADEDRHSKVQGAEQEGEEWNQNQRSFCVHIPGLTPFVTAMGSVLRIHVQQ